VLVWGGSRFVPAWDYLIEYENITIQQPALFKLQSAKCRGNNRLAIQPAKQTTLSNSKYKY